MDAKAHTKPHHHKKCRIKAQERFAKKFPYRFSWLTEPKPEPLQPWETKNTSLRSQLPLQKNLVPTRSIPVPGFGAPDLALSSGFVRQPPPPPQCNLWEFKLLSLRFPGLSSRLLAPVSTDAESHRA